MDHRIQGIGEHGQVYRGPGWYAVPEVGFPSAHKCVCGSWCVDGEWVYCVQYELSKVRRTFAFHRQCMREALDAAPIDQYEAIRERVGAGGPLWTE